MKKMTLQDLLRKNALLGMRRKLATVDEVVEETPKTESQEAVAEDASSETKQEN